MRFRDDSEGSSGRKKRLAFATVAGALTAAIFVAAIPEELPRRNPASAFGGSGDPYRFGGACPSQGQWTQAALENTQQVYSAISGLLNNPKCKGKESTINGIVENFKSAEGALQDARADKLGMSAETLPAELNALRASVISGAGNARAASELLFNSDMKAAGLVSQAAQGMAGTATSLAVGPSAVLSLYNRTARAGAYGAQMAQQIFAALPSLDECLMGQPNVALSVYAAAIKVGAAFSSAGQGLGQSLGGALASLVTSMRDRRFTRVMGQLDRVELYNSISCLLETTAKNYCDTENARWILKASQDAYAKNAADGARDPDDEDAMRGYYLLTRELPLIANWITQVKLGTEPRGTGDSAQQKEAIRRISDFWEMKKDIAGNFNLHYQDMMAAPSLSARQQAVLTIITDATDSLSKGAGRDFVLQGLDTPQLLPYFLIGLDTVPEEMRISQKNIRDIPYYQWMGSGANGKMQPQFNDPVALAATVKMRLDVLLNRADQNANAFFRKRLVVDPLNLVSASLSSNGQNMTVFQALQSVSRYLTSLRSRLSNSDADNAILAMIDETATRISAVTGAYQQIAQIGRELRTGTAQVEQRKDDIKRAADAIIDVVFSQFLVLYQSDAFLTKRLTTLIQRDFAIRLKHGLDLTRHQKEIMAASQDHLVEQIVQFHGQNLNAAILDIANAYTINQQTLARFEEAFGDQLYLMIAELESIAHNRPTSVNSMSDAQQALLKRNKLPARAAYWKDFNDVSIPRDGWLGALSQSLKDFWFAYCPGCGLKHDHPELYAQNRNMNAIPVYGDNQFGDTAQRWAQLCIQSLALSQRDRYFRICKGAVLRSAFTTQKEAVRPLDENRSLEIPYDSAWMTKKKSMKISDWAKQVNSDARLRSQRICAFNNYMMRNLVQYLQDRDQSEDDQSTTSDAVPSETSSVPNAPTIPDGRPSGN